MREKKFIMLLIFVIYFSTLEICLAARMWRYYPASSNDYGYITTKTKFIVEYFGSTEWASNNWHFEEHCHVDDITSPTTTVICSTSGYHPFGILEPSMNILDMENILVIKSPYCYEWQMALLSVPSNTSLSAFELEFQLWIRKMDEVEQNSSSSVPSEISKHMTKVFYQIGQRPSIFAFVSHSNDEIGLAQQEIEFTSNESVWNVSLTVTTLELLKIKVDESTVGFLNCFIKSTVFEVQHMNHSAAAALNATQVLSWDNITKLLDLDNFFDDGSNWSYQFLPSNSLSVLIWDTRDVYYKSAKGEANITITVKGNISNPADGAIVQVVTSSNGEYLVLYEDNSLFYGRIGVNYMILLNSSFPDDVQVRFLFDLMGNAYVLYSNTSSSTVTKTNYALDNKIFNSVYPDIYCPFIEFSFGKLSSSNVLDKWEQFEIWAYLVFKRSYKNDITLVWNPTEDVELTVSERKEFYKDVIMINKTFKFEEKMDANSSSITSSSYSVTILPKLNSMTCKRPFHKVYHFHAGCPPTRRAVIRDARSSDETFSEERESFSLSLSSGDTFFPAIFIFDEYVLKRKVNSTFVIVELNSRTDFAVRVGQVSEINKTIMSFDGSGSFIFLLRFNDQNVSFCQTELKFDVYVKEEGFADYVSYVEFACVTLFTIGFMAFLVFNYLLYRKAFLQRHEEDDKAKNRLQELQYLAQLQYYRAASNATTASIPAPGSEDTKRRAALVTGKNVGRTTRRSSVFERVSKGVFEDLKIQDRSKSLQEPPRELETFDSASRRNTMSS